jgi:acyl carrier protein
MDRLTVMKTLKTILVDLGIPEDSLCEDTLLYAHLRLDSVEIVRLALELKRQLGLDLRLGGQQDMTLAQICDLAEVASSAQAL